MKRRVIFAALLFVALFFAGLFWRADKMVAPEETPVQATEVNNERSAEKPNLKTEIIAEGLTNPWDVAVLGDGSILVTERAGSISVIRSGTKKELLRPSGLVAKGEGGLMGLTIDQQFGTNRFVYACYNTSTDIRLSRWRLSETFDKLENQVDIVTGLPVTTGRHSGCRPRFGADGNLWIGTGDVATGTNPQNPKSLAGKILRVNRDGKAVSGNMAAPNDERIFSIGHRNVQGMAMLPRAENGNYGYSVEHGPDRDDEVNPLLLGNFGWDPVPGYNESVAMTDKKKYPNAIDAIWNSGQSTIAPGGASILVGPKWKGWEGSIAMAALKGKHLRILHMRDGKLSSETELFKNEYGRVRSATLGLDNDLYLTTDNGNGQDKIVRVSPN